MGEMHVFLILVTLRKSCLSQTRLDNTQALTLANKLYRRQKGEQVPKLSLLPNLGSPENLKA